MVSYFCCTISAKFHWLNPKILLSLMLPHCGRLKQGTGQEDVDVGFEGLAFMVGYRIGEDSKDDRTN